MGCQQVPELNTHAANEATQSDLKYIYSETHTRNGLKFEKQATTRTLPVDTEPATVNLEKSTNKTCDCFLDDYGQSSHFLSKINEKPPLVTFRGEKTHDRIRCLKAHGRCQEAQ